MPRKLTCSLEMSILILLFGVVVIMLLFGIINQVDAAPSYPPQVNRAITELRALTGADKRDVFVVSYREVTFKGASVDCPKVTGLVNVPTHGYSVILANQGVFFYYRVDRFQTFLCHVEFGRGGIN